MIEPMKVSMDARWAEAKAETEARLAVTFAAYGVPFGTGLEDNQKLAHAKISRLPMSVPVRMRTGELVHFSIEQAIKALLQGGKLEIENVEPVAPNVASSNRPVVQRKPSRA